MELIKKYLLFVSVAIFVHSMCSCEKSELPEVDDKPEVKIDPALLKAIKLRDEAIQTTQVSLIQKTPLDDETYLAMWREIDPSSKRANLKLWSYMVAVQMGLSQEEIEKEINEKVSEKKIDETWEEAIQFQLSEYRKRIKGFQKEYSSPKDQEAIKDLPDQLFRHEGPFVKDNRAYSLIYRAPEKHDSYSRLLVMRPIIFDEHRRQDDGSWKRVDWTTWNKVVSTVALPANFTTALDKPHVSAADIEALAPSFKEALNTWKALIEHPEKIDSDSFIAHCDPAMLESWRKWFVDYYHYSVLCGEKSDYDHLFTWSDIYRGKLKELNTIDFWKDYLKYCKDHIEGDFFDEEDDYAYSDLILQIIPSRRDHTLYERYLQSGYKTNIFITALFSPPTILQIHDLVPVDENTMYVIYRQRSENSVFRGLNREVFVRVDGQWKFQRSAFNFLLENRALNQKDEYEEMKKEKENTAD